MDCGNLYLSLVVHFDFHYRGHVGEEAAVHGNSHTRALTQLLFAPSGLLRSDLDHTTHASGVERIIRGRRSRTVVLGRGSFHVHDACRAQEVQQIFNRIASRVVRQLVGEGVGGKGVIDIGHRAEPSDPNVVVGLTIFHAMIREIRWRSVSTQAQFPGASIMHVVREGGIDGREHRTL